MQQESIKFFVFIWGWCQLYATFSAGKSSGSTSFTSLILVPLFVDITGNWSLTTALNCAPPPGLPEAAAAALFVKWSDVC